MYDGAYTITDVRPGRFDLDAPVEGMHESWSERLLLEIESMTPAQRRGAFAVLYTLQAAFLPPAYLRSLPIARLERVVNYIVRELTPDP